MFFLKTWQTAYIYRKKQTQGQFSAGRSLRTHCCINKQAKQFLPWGFKIFTEIKTPLGWRSISPSTRRCTFSVFNFHPRTKKQDPFAVFCHERGAPYKHTEKRWAGLHHGTSKHEKSSVPRELQTREGGSLILHRNETKLQRQMAASECLKKGVSTATLWRKRKNKLPRRWLSQEKMSQP